MGELPKLGSVWGVIGNTSTWMQIRETSDGRVVGRMFNGGEKHISNNFPPAGYVRIDKPSIIRTDTEGRDVTDLPGMWSEDDTITDLSQPHTVEEVFNRFAEEGWSGDAAALGIDGFKKAIAALDAADPQRAELAQPFTVEWLCEIGGRKVRDGNQFSVSFGFGNPLKYWAGENNWTLRGMILPSTAKITTRGDVLKWLDVLGIVPKVPA